MRRARAGRSACEEGAFEAPSLGGAFRGAWWLDVWVNNAGIEVRPLSPTRELPPDVWEKTSLNLTGVFLAESGARISFRGARPAGRIINLLSPQNERRVPAHVRAPRAAQRRRSQPATHRAVKSTRTPQHPRENRTRRAPSKRSIFHRVRSSPTPDARAQN